MTNEIRDRILDAAVELLERHGTRAFRQARIAELAGVRQSHLTYYFPTRADLLDGVFERAVERQLQRIAGLLKNAGDAAMPARPLEGAKAIVRDTRRTRLLLSLFVEAHEGRAGLLRRIRDSQRAQRETFAHLFGRDDDDVLVDLVLAAIRGMALDQLLAPRNSERIEQLFDLLRELLEKNGTGVRPQG
jgi:AcrR family transcriptional regulator